MKSFIASVASVGGAVLTIKEVAEAGSVIVSLLGACLALSAGWYARRIQKRKWELLNKK